MDNGDLLKNTPIYVCKDYYNHVPLSWHYINKRLLDEEFIENKNYQIKYEGDNLSDTYAPIGYYKQGLGNIHEAQYADVLQVGNTNISSLNFDVGKTTTICILVNLAVGATSLTDMVRMGFATFSDTLRISAETI